jgi:glycosyltransferase involved in cell wall biosynthesis
VLLFADGPFAEVLRDRGVACRVEPLGPAAASRTKEGGGRGGGVAAWGETLVLAGRLARTIREEGWDVIYTNTPKALVAGAVAAAWAGVPFVHHLHDLVDAGHFGRWNRRILVAAANRARRIIANSRATADAFVRAGGNARLVEVIPNGFDLDRYRRADGAVEGGRCVFGLFGRITPWKGQDVFLEALARLPADQARGVIVGAALFTDEDRRFEAGLRERAARPDLAGRVTFTGFRSDVAEAMRREVDVVVHASVQEEPFGRVIVEGMLCGRPVIATRGGGVLDLVEDGETGRLVEPGDVGALAEAMRWMAEHPAEREAMARRGEDSARERFGLETVLRRTWEVVAGI